MPEAEEQTPVNPDPAQRQDNGTEPLLGSGFEVEQPEPAFDDRI